MSTMTLRLYLTFFVLAVILIVVGVFVGKEHLHLFQHRQQQQQQQQQLQSSQRLSLISLQQNTLKNNSLTKDIIRHSKAAEINSLLNKKIDPCVNFYKFSCGSWSQHYPAQLASSHYRSEETLLTNKFELMYKNTKHRLQSIFLGDDDLFHQGDVNNNSNNNNNDNIRSFYLSCIRIPNDFHLYKTSLKEIYSGFTTAFKFPTSISKKSSSEMKKKNEWWSLLAQIQQKYNQKILIDIELFQCQDKRCLVKTSIMNDDGKFDNKQQQDNGGLVTTTTTTSIEEQQSTEENNSGFGDEEDISTFEEKVPITMIEENLNDMMIDYKLYLKPIKIQSQTLSKEQIGAGLRILFDLNENDARKLAEELIDFDRALTHAISSTGKHNLNSRRGIKYDLEDFYDRYESMWNLRRYIEIAHNITDLPTTIYVINEQYLLNLEGIIDEREETVIIAYILWKLMEKYLIIYPKIDINQRRGDYNDNTMPYIHDICYRRTEFEFHRQLEYLFYQKYHQQRDEVHGMWQEIKQIFEKYLNGLKDTDDFLTQNTIELALEKLRQMSLYIDINEEELQNFSINSDETLLNEYNFVSNVKYLGIQRLKRKINQTLEDWLKSNVSITTPSMSFPHLQQLKLFDFEIVYETGMNRIKFPFGLLQPRYLWADEYPSAVRYATLGYLLAHHMIQGFIGRKRHYYSHHPPQNVSWWDEKSSYAYDARLNCFYYQMDDLYRSEIIGKNALPREWQLEEVIAKEVTALQIAYKAFIKREESQERIDPINLTNDDTIISDHHHHHRQDDRIRHLPNLKYTDNQLFFINFAQLFCEDVEASSRNHLRKSYTPAEYRVLASVINYREFAWTFQCMIGSPMHPPYICAIY